MPEWTIQLPPLTLQVNCAELPDSGLLAVAGGRQPEAAWLRARARGKTIYCADRGAAYCQAAGLVPTAIFGDGDSAAPEVYALAAAHGAAIHSYKPEKDDTDLQLLLEQLPAARLVATGVWGGRFDHLYSNVFSLLAYKQQKSAQVILADEREAMLLLAPGESVRGSVAAGNSIKALSLLPLGSTAVASVEGVRWPLRAASLELLHPYAVSNLPQREFSCSCHAGMLGVYFCFYADA